MTIQPPTNFLNVFSLAESQPKDFKNNKNMPQIAKMHGFQLFLSVTDNFVQIQKNWRRHMTPRR